MRHLVLSLLLAMASAVSLATAASVKKYGFVEEWNLWKSDHGKTYETEEVITENIYTALSVSCVYICSILSVC